MDRLTTFYPLDPIEPFPVCAERPGQPVQACAPSTKSVVQATGLGYGRTHFTVLHDLSACQLPAACRPRVVYSHAAAGHAFMRAPSGMTPYCRYFHSAIASLRATATIMIRLPRLPAPWVRRANHWLIAVLGW